MHDRTYTTKSKSQMPTWAVDVQADGLLLVNRLQRQKAAHQLRGGAGREAWFRVENRRTKTVTRAIPT